MLANLSPIPNQSGTLSKDVHLPASSLRELLDFITDELPRWRDRPDRLPGTSETTLTSQLCAHLNSTARNSPGWDILQFRTEEPDEQKRGRKIDLVSAPCGTTVWIEGRSYTDFDSLLPIECKRLPTPPGQNRDEREYVFSRYSTTGGIQRFKAGHHGASHAIGAMIGYIQEETPTYWHGRVVDWISQLVETGEPGWSDMDVLDIVRTNETLRSAVLSSSHDRGIGQSKIELSHLWLEMN
jgi:hypothetical protein